MDRTRYMVFNKGVLSIILQHATNVNDCTVKCNLLWQLLCCLCESDQHGVKYPYTQIILLKQLNLEMKAEKTSSPEY